MVSRRKWSSGCVPIMKLTSSGCVPIMKSTSPTPPPQGCVSTTESILCVQVSQNPVCAAESILCAQVRHLPFGGDIGFIKVNVHTISINFIHILYSGNQYINQILVDTDRVNGG